MVNVLENTEQRIVGGSSPLPPAYLFSYENWPDISVYLFILIIGPLYHNLSIVKDREHIKSYKCGDLLLNNNQTIEEHLYMYSLYWPHTQREEGGGGLCQL